MGSLLLAGPLRCTAMFHLTAAIFSVVLLLTGLRKIQRPGDTSRALSALGLPNWTIVGVLIGIAEVTVGALALATSWDVGLLAQGVLYVLFTSWVAWALVKDAPVESCGCLGKPDTPPYLGHLILDSLAAVVSFAAIGSPSVLFEGAFWNLVAQLVLLVAGVLLAWGILDHGARLRGALAK